MPRKESPSVRTTLYRVRGINDLTDAVRSKYLGAGGFTAAPGTVEGSESLLVTGAMHRRQTTWAGRLSTLSGENVSLGNTTVAALLIIRSASTEAWALAYGIGFQLLEPAHIDPGFGMRVAIRTAQPNAIQSLTRSELDHRARTDRSSIPAGEALRGFGIGDFGEVVTRISGTAAVSGLALGDASVRIRAADALSIPLGKTPRLLMSDLDAIAATLDLTPQPELEALEQFVRVKDAKMIEQLKEELQAALAGGSNGRLALGWPHERINDNGTPSAFKLLGTGKHNVEAKDDLPSLDDLLEAIGQKAPDDRFAGASSIKVQLFRDSDAEEPVSGAIPAIYWLFFEIEINGVRYCLFDSCWYAIDTDYAQRLQSHVDEIFARPPAVALPNWSVATCPGEGAYNAMAAESLGGVMLDRQLLRTTQHPRGFEACDIITKDGLLIHVKHTPKSSAVSHLIAQALVSTDALRHDNEARQKLRDLTADAGGDASWLPDRLSSVMLAMARLKPITAEGLFSFSQVTLTRLDSLLAEAGVTLTIGSVKREERPVGAAAATRVTAPR